jgi:hypothetical protein
MLIEFLNRLGSLFARASDRERDAYLESSTDLADLERRMRQFDRSEYQFDLHSRIDSRERVN